jgi:hypothetical protein
MIVVCTQVKLKAHENLKIRSYCRGFDVPSSACLGTAEFVHDVRRTFTWHMQNFVGASWGVHLLILLSDGSGQSLEKSPPPSFHQNSKSDSLHRIIESPHV